MLLHRGSIVQVFCELLISFAFGMRTKSSASFGSCDYRQTGT
jgi:hypothetical protein